MGPRFTYGASDETFSGMTDVFRLSTQAERYEEIYLKKSYMCVCVSIRKVELLGYLVKTQLVQNIFREKFQSF